MKKPKDEVSELVLLYFKVNPNMDKGIAFRAKAYDTISKYYTTYKKSKEEIQHCIESTPMNAKPIWNAFYDYFFTAKTKEKSEYKDTINKSLNPDDWL